MGYITIYETVNSTEISIIRNLLDENNIDYQMPDEFTNSSAGIAGLGIRGMRVQVSEQNKSEAIALLKDRGFNL